MAKPISLKQARKMLKKAGCTKERSAGHETWKREDGDTFALPHSSPTISAGVVRQLTYFVKGDEDYRGR